jgi:hypothetical protein
MTRMHSDCQIIAKRDSLLFDTGRRRRGFRLCYGKNEWGWSFVFVVFTGFVFGINYICFKRNVESP